MIDRMLGLLDRLYGLGEKARNAELKNLTADLRLAIAELREEIANQKTENAQLRGKLSELRKRLNVRRTVKYRNGLYYLKKPKPGLSKGPFCTVCFEEDGLLITLKPTHRVRLSDRTTHFSGWRCSRCSRRSRSGS